MVEGAPLLRAYGSKAHRGFESLPLRHAFRKISSLSLVRVARRARAEGPSQSLPLRHGFPSRWYRALAHVLNALSKSNFALQSLLL